tara:strand:+ start:252 stop:536 length:285 start_codon:yes stop_codon:yes gene_type:complete
MKKLKKAVKVIGTIANPKAAVAKAVVGNVMGPKGQARRKARRARRAARKASAMGGENRMNMMYGGERATKSHGGKHSPNDRIMYAGGGETLTPN